MKRSLVLWFAWTFVGCVAAGTALCAHTFAAPLLPAPQGDAFFSPPSPLPDAPPGALIWARESQYSNDPLLQTPDDSVRAWQLLYISTSALDAPIAIAATLLVPRAPYTEGPRPLIGHATGSVGTGETCALTKFLVEGSYNDPLLPAALARGWAVVLTNYEGLGTPGDHPWAISRPLGHSLIDSLRASLAVDGGDLSSENPIAIWGYSEGGFATAAAAEMLSDYGAGLNIVAASVGAAAVSLADLLEFIDGGTYSGPAFLMGMLGLDAAYSELALETYLNDRGKSALATERTACIFDIQQLPLLSVKRGDLTTRDPLRERAVQARLELNRLGVRAPGIPINMYHAPNDDMVPFESGRRLRDAYCSLNVHVTWTEVPDSDHVAGQTNGHEQALAWVADRLAGRPLPNTFCTPSSGNAARPSAMASDAGAQPIATPADTRANQEDSGARDAALSPTPGRSAPEPHHDARAAPHQDSAARSDEGQNVAPAGQQNASGMAATPSVPQVHAANGGCSAGGKKAGAPQAPVAMLILIALACFRRRSQLVSSCPRVLVSGVAHR